MSKTKMAPAPINLFTSWITKLSEVYQKKGHFDIFFSFYWTEYNMLQAKDPKLITIQYCQTSLKPKEKERVT